MESQYKSKKSGQKSSEDNKLYIEFLKHCELDQNSLGLPCFSPTSTGALRSHGNSYSHKNLNSFLESNQNLYAGGLKTHNNIQSSVQLKIQNQFTSNTPSSAVSTVTTLFDFMLKKHDQLYKEMLRQKEANNSKSTNDRKSLLVTQAKVEDKKVKINFTSTQQNCNDIGGESRRNTMQVGSNQSNNFIEDNNAFFNILQKEESVKVIYKNPLSLTVQKFKVKIVPLIMQEPLLAISIQDITYIEEEKKVKKIEQDNNTINVQVISKIKQHLEYLYRNLSKIRSQKMKQSVIFPLNIIRSTALIDKNKITYEPFTVNNLLKDLATTFSNVVQVKIKQNIDPAQNYLNRLTSKNDGNLIQGKENSLSQEDEGEFKDFELIDPRSFEEQELSDEVKYQKESIVSKYNLAGIISANHDFLSFSSQNRLNRQQTNQLASLQHIQGDYWGFRGITNQVTSEMSIPQVGNQITKQKTDKFIRDERINSLQDINLENRKLNFQKNGNKIPIRQQENETNQQQTDPSLRQDNLENVNRKNWMIKSISNDNLVGNTKNNQQSKVNEGHSSHIVVGSSFSHQFQPSSQSDIQSKAVKQKLVSQINSKLKQLDEYTINKTGGIINLQEQRLKMATTTTAEDLQKRGQSIPSTTTGTSFLQQASLAQIKQNVQEQEENNHNHLLEQAIPIKKTSIHQNNNNSANFRHLSAHNLFVHPQNSHQHSHNNSFQQVRDDRHSSVGQQSSNNIPSASQIEQDVLINPPKKQNYASMLTSSYRVDLGTGANSLLNSFYGNHISTNRNLSIPQQFENKLHNQENSVFTNFQQIKSSTRLETDGNEIASEREQKLNCILNNTTKKANNNGDIKILSNYRLVLQALSGIITCFGQQNIQIIIETFNKKLYNSIRFKIKPAHQQPISQTTNQNTTNVTPVFNFENSPQINNNNDSKQMQHFHQYSMFPNLNTPANHLNNMSPASNYSNMLTTNQIAIDTLNSPSKIQSKQSSTVKTAKFDMNSTKKILLTEEDFKKNLYDLSQLTNKQLINKIWRSIKDIASSIGPEKLEFSENTISIEFFTNMNVIKDPKFGNQEINLNGINKPNRNSIFSIQYNSLQNQLSNNNNFINQQSQSNNSNNIQNQSNNLTAQFNSLSIKENNMNFNNSNQNNNNISYANSLVLGNSNNLQNNISQNMSLVQNNLSITNNYLNLQKFDPLSVTNKNSFNNLYQQNNNNNNTSFQNNYLSNTYISEQNGITSSQQQGKFSKALQKNHQQFPSYQPTNISNQPFKINSKLRIPEEEEQQPYRKKQNSINSLSLVSIQSQQDEGVREVQPIKNFLNQNAKFYNN